jgi:hypothetical protein
MQIDAQAIELFSMIERWRNGGPAQFAMEVFGLPEHWDPKLKRGIQDWQWEASELLVKKRRLSVRSGHGVGKSAFLAWTVLWFLTCYFPTRIPCTAPTGHQLSDVLWAEVTKWLREMDVTCPALAKQIEVKKDTICVIDAPKESFAAARTARPEKPEALQGFHSEHLLVIVDEASGVPDKIFEVGEGTLTEESAFIIMTSNPTRTSGYFYDSHHKMRSRWGNMHVSGRDSPLVSKQYVEDMEFKYGKDSNVVRVRVDGDFPRAEDDAVIPLELVEAAVNRDVEPFGPRIWGVDVARFGDDRTVLIKRCTNATLGVHISWQGKDTMQTAGKIYVEWLDTPPEHRPVMIAVDVIGVGAGVADRLTELGLPVFPVNVSEEPSVDDNRYLRLRDELWFKAREWLQKKDCRLERDDVLTAELTLPKYKYTSQGKLQVQSKDEMKKIYPQSPDVADAFCLTFCLLPEKGGKGSVEPEVFEDGI